MLEVQALHGRHVEVHVDGGWRRVRVLDVITDQGEDWAILGVEERLAVSRIEMARPAGD